MATKICFTDKLGNRVCIPIWIDPRWRWKIPHRVLIELLEPVPHPWREVGIDLGALLAAPVTELREEAWLSALGLSARQQRDLAAVVHVASTVALLPPESHRRMNAILAEQIASLKMPESVAIELDGATPRGVRPA